MANVSLQNLKKQFGTAVAVSDFSLQIEDGELVAFLGPSGCGKTTTLRMIAGFVAPTSGRIFIGDVDVTHMPAHKRNTGMVFQRYALFPHMTVSENIAFGLEMHKVPAVERDKRIKAAQDMVRMTNFKDRYPRQLSGGQQQRVAIARALAIQPKVFLLDEPLSNLDAKLRQEVRDEVRALQQNLGLTTIFVTHDQEEALAISDRMVIMHDGIVQQVGTPNDLYERPRNLFVADFLGKMNFFTGSVNPQGAFVSESGVLIKTSPLTEAVKTVGVRPERVYLANEPMFDNSIRVDIKAVAYLGSHIDVTAQYTNRSLLRCQVANSSAIVTDGLRVGSSAWANFKADDCVVLDT